MVYLSNLRAFERDFLVFYIVMISFQTLLNRELGTNPLSNVIDTWGLCRIDATKNQMVLITEDPENLALFIPFTILLLWIYRRSITGEVVHLILTRTLYQSMKIVLLFSFAIEMLQLFWSQRTWQLSSLFSDTLVISSED